MSQIIFKNPFVSVAPSYTGTGNGTVSINKLTHFTLAQVYTLTCTASAPDTLFSVAGSLDGAVGIATVGTQFFDQDLKVFLTIQQGSTPFAVGDQIQFTVANGTDVNQQNIDTYDELPQKNFGVGLLGVARGDHNFRFSATALSAYLYLKDLFFQAVAPSDDTISMQYSNYIPGVDASLVVQDLTLTAVAPGVAGNSITFKYLDATVSSPASVIIQDLQYVANNGSAGNSITIAYTTGATAGSEVVSVIGNAISVQIQSGVSTATQIKSAVDASSPAHALVPTVVISGVGSNPQTAPVSPTSLSGGLDDQGLAGFEVVTVSGNNITVQAENGVSTATQVKAALDASAPAIALVATAISGTGSNPQSTTPNSATPLAGGTDSIGFTAPAVVVTANAINVFLNPGVATATQIKAALDAFSPAAALITTTIIGSANEVQFSPVAATFLTGGKNKNWALNHNEQTDSGSFLEGNGSLDAQDLSLRGAADISGAVSLKRTLALANADSGNTSGSPVADTQQYLNQLNRFRKAYTYLASQGKVTWSGTQLSSNQNLIISINGILNTLLASNFPISLSDGYSIFVRINPDTAGNSTYYASNTADSSVFSFRLATRVGTNLVLFNGTVLDAGDTASLGNNPSYKTQIIASPTSSGIITHSSVTLGQVTLAASIVLNYLGSSAVVTIASGTFSLSDGQIAYVLLDSPGVTGSKSIQLVSPSNTALLSTEAYVLFQRVGSLIFFRNGDSLAQGESARFLNSGSSSTNIVGSIIARDSSGDFAARNAALNKATVAVGSGNGLDVSGSGNLEIGASIGSNEILVGSTTSTTVIKGNLEVQGTTTTIDSQTLDVADKNITVNKSGTDASSEGAGLTIDRVSTKGSLIYANASPSKFKAGDFGSEIELANISSAQTLTNKTLAVASNPITSTANKAAQFNTSTGNLEPSSVSNTELGYVVGVTSSIQAQIDSKVAIASYRAGSVSLSLNDTTKAITFSSAFPSTNYRVKPDFVNTTDSMPQFQSITITAKTTAGFTATWNAGVDSANYSLDFIAFLDN